MMMPILLETSSVHRRGAVAPVLVKCPVGLELESSTHWPDKPNRVSVRRRIVYQSSTDATSIVVSEWSPGEWPYAATEPEFCQILSGRGTFMPDGGEPVPLRAGDAIVMPSGSIGRWVVVETLRRLSLTLPRTS